MTDTSYPTSRGDTMDPYEDIRRERAARVLRGAMRVAERDGLASVTRSIVAREAKVAPATVSNAYGGMPALHEAVMNEAVKRPVLAVLAQGLAMGDPIARAAPEATRQAALASLT